MLLTKEQVKQLPDGTKFKIFLSGSAWDNDFGKAYDVIRIGNELRRITPDWWDINEMDDNDDGDYSYEVAKL